MKVLEILRNWTLPIAMMCGTCVYFLFAAVPFFDPVKPAMYGIIDILTPTLIFVMLLLTFCKVSPKDLKVGKWHLWLILFQIVASIAAYFVLLPLSEPMAQSAMVCIICPTATAAAVITGKLGGSVPHLTTYTLMSNLVAAVYVPIMFPIIEPHEEIEFLGAFLIILKKVFVLLICPFLTAVILRYMLPKVHSLLMKCSGMAFYLWALSLAIVTGQTVKSLVNSTDSVSNEVMIALSALAVCVLQFAVGRGIGRKFDDTISAGQALGQKNTILAIWMAYTYLNPLSSVGPGAYVLWQNIINSWQLYRKRKADQKAGIS